MLSTLILLALVETPLSFTVHWRLGEVVDPGDKVVCTVLDVGGRGVIADYLPADQKPAFAEAIRAIRANYTQADRSGRARLNVSYMRFATLGNSVSYYSSWFALPDGNRLHAVGYSYPQGHAARALRDDTTGEYVAIVTTAKGQNLAQMLAELAAAADSQKGPNPKDLDRLKRAAANVSLMLEVNGLRQYIAAGSPPGTAVAELAASWKTLGADASRRIAYVWAVLQALDEGKLRDSKGSTDFTIAGSPPLADRDGILGFPALGEGFLFRDVATTPVGLLPPPDDQVQKVLGRRPWPIPDLSYSFKEQVRHLLSQH